MSFHIWLSASDAGWAESWLNTVVPNSFLLTFFFFWQRRGSSLKVFNRNSILEQQQSLSNKVTIFVILLKFYLSALNNFLFYFLLFFRFLMPLAMSPGVLMDQFWQILQWLQETSKLERNMYDFCYLFVTRKFIF